MKNILQWRALRLMIPLLWGGFAVLLTTQSDEMPVVHLMVSTIGSTTFGATLGHMGLFGALALVTFMAFSLRLTRNHALWMAMALTLLVATATELHQGVVSSRDASLSDLLANWLGVFIIGFGIAYLTLMSRTPPANQNAGQS